MEELKYHYKYPHPSVTTDCVIFGFDGKKLNVLLVQRGNEPYKGCWAFPGGFLNMDESAEEGALRELCEETGLSGPSIREFHSFSEPKRDPRERVITISYYSLVKISDVCGGDDAARAEWFPLDAVPSLAFDHNEMLRIAVGALRRDIYFEPVGAEVLPEKFTKEEYVALYGAVGSDGFDARAFFDAMLKRGFVVSAGVCRDSEGSVPLFSYCREKYDSLRNGGYCLEL